MSPIDPDEAPTHSGDRASGDRPNDRQRSGRKPDPAPSEDRTIPSMQAAAANKAKPAGKTDNMIGKVIGGCRIDSLLGRGAMGAVYKARQVSLDRDVAVKVIRPEMMADPRMLKRFEVEARTVGKFNSAHVVMVHDVGFEHGVHYLVMEFVQGKNMREHTKLLAGGRLPAGEAIPLLRQACKGLEEAQRLSVIHRDIKPDNLMLTDRGVLKIADFGIAKPIHEDFNMTMTSELIGTPLYMSPEQCQGKADLDFRSDMYSLGATFYYLLTGEPPIRASSVYELIQTKTKLENLCLWKALAELDQNHPLSRVIERMTSLDREDRYESYESLLNDIVLVEQGGTVTIPEKGSARARAARAKAKKKKNRNVLVGVVLLLAVAGGGYAWSVSAGGGGPGDGKGVSVPDSKQLVARLTLLRTRLSSNGPDPNLRIEVEGVPEEPSTKAIRSGLLEDVDRGLPVRARLDKVKPPEALTVPFDDLKAYFASVDKALEVDGMAGRDLQTWLVKTRANARAETALGAIAVTSLTVAFREWQADRANAGNDEAKLLVLEKRLAAIEAGRRTLLVQIPSQEGPLDRALPLTTLDKARLSLTQKSVGAVGDVDVSEVLTEIQQRFEASGPDAALVERTKAVTPTRDDQKAAKDQLLIALERAGGVAGRLESTRQQSKPEDPELPFESVESYYAMIERGLDPLRTGGALPQWAQALRTKLRDEKDMQASVMRKCRNAYTRWSKQREELSGSASEELVADLQQLRAGIAAAGRLFPDSKAEFEKIIPVTAQAEVKADFERGKTRQVWLGSAKKLLDVLNGVKQLGDWRIVATQSNTDLEALRADAATLSNDAAVKRDLQAATKLRDSWTEADKRVTDLAAKIAAGDLKGADNVARTGVPGLEGKDELGQLGVAAAKCRDAFDGLDSRLEIDQASALLADARESMKGCANLAPAADARIKDWIAKVGDLKRTAAGMVQIESGTTRASAQQIQAFFIASTECSLGDFNKFLRELRAAVENIKDPAARLQAVAPRLVGAEINQERLGSLLNKEERRASDKLPVDRIDWHAAAAYCAWNGLVLPTRPEWALAAFGPGNRFPYPWGPDWSNDPQQRNPNNKQLAEVDAGGLSWRKPEGKSLHHLGGNVAEWLAAEPGATSAPQAGGRYNDSDSKAREAAGGAMSDVEKTDLRQGVGFRTALRPRTFIGQLWPR